MAGANMICQHCSKPFEPKRPHQKFCCTGCRSAHHAAGDGGLRAAVSSVRVTKRGGVSVILRFAPIDRENAAKLTPGEMVEVVK